MFKPLVVLAITFAVLIWSINGMINLALESRTTEQAVIVIERE